MGAQAAAFCSSMLCDTHQEALPKSRLSSTICRYSQELSRDTAVGLAQVLPARIFPRSSVCLMRTFSRDVHLSAELRWKARCVSASLLHMHGCYGQLWEAPPQSC